jgi:hypothetical protein
MPTVFIQKGYRFFFYAADLDEPIHVHIEKSGKHAKFWVQSVLLAMNGGFREHELNEIERIIDRRAGEIIARWHKEQGKREDR